MDRQMDRDRQTKEQIDRDKGLGRLSQGQVDRNKQSKGHVDRDCQADRQTYKQADIY